MKIRIHKGFSDGSRIKPGMTTSYNPANLSELGIYAQIDETNLMRALHREGLRSKSVVIHQLFLIKAIWMANGLSETP